MRAPGTAPTPKRALPWLVAVAFFMQTLDGTILNTALPSMALDLGESPLRMHSVVIAYMLTVALLIPASGWLSDHFGTRRVFLAAIVVFCSGSLLCALSSSLPALVASRIVQGMGGALLLPVGRLAILRVFSKGELVKVLAFVTIPGLIGPLIGPTLGGLLVEMASWHWVFFLNLPVGFAGLIAAAHYMPDLRAPVGRFDLGGFTLFSFGLVVASLALDAAGERSIAPALSLLGLATGAASMAAYWLRASRVDAPLFSPRLFSIPTFTLGLAGNLFSRLGSGAMPFLTPLFLQVGLGYSPTRAGMSMIPTVLGAMLSKTVAATTIESFGHRSVLIVNTLLLGALIAAFGLIDSSSPSYWILIHLALFGLVNSLQFTAMNTLALGDLDQETASSGNSLLSVVMQLSMSLGVTAAGALLQVFNQGQGLTPGVDTAFQTTFVCVGLLTSLATFIFFQLGKNEVPESTREIVDES